MLGRYQRRTARLNGQVKAVAKELAGRAGSRLLAVLAMGLSRHTALRALLRIPLPTGRTPRVIGVDDVALRRRHRYATVVIDAETHERIEVLPDRTADTLEAWLRAHPGVEVVCREGSATYAVAIRRALPNAVQVADRWHLWHNLCEAALSEVKAHSTCWAPVLDAPIYDGPRAQTTLERWHQVHDLLDQGVTRFRAFRRSERRMLLAALDTVVGASPDKLGDVVRYAERWKRLGERLHPHEYNQWPHAQEVFAVARGERRVRNLADRAEAAIRAGAIGPAASLLSAAPGLLLRSADRLLRLASASERTAVVEAVTGALGSASGRVLLSLREHVGNRLTPASARMYASRSRNAWVGPDERPPLPAGLVAELSSLLDAEISARLPEPERPLVVDPEVLDVALPLSGKAAEGGFAVLPRGSRASVSGELLRFFTYWRQTSRRTDYDLSVLLLDDEFRSAGQVSWTNYHHHGVVHSGDITDATNGATEFIDVPLTARGHYVVPQVNIYSGESFDEVAESMFGYQTRTLDQRGAPFDARTVRARSHLRGQGRVALPVVFTRGEHGWQAVWLHLYLRGRPSFNRVEDNTFTTAHQVRALVERRYLTMSYLVDRWRARAEVTMWNGRLPDEPVTFIGVEAPEELPDGSEAYTVNRLSELIPE